MFSVREEGLHFIINPIFLLVEAVKNPLVLSKKPGDAPKDLRRTCRLGGLLRRPGRAPPAAAARRRRQRCERRKGAGGEEVAAGATCFFFGFQWDLIVISMGFIGDLYGIYRGFISIGFLWD